MSLYRKMTAAEVMAAQAGVTSEGVTHGVTQAESSGVTPGDDAAQLVGGGSAVVPASEEPATPTVANPDAVASSSYSVGPDTIGEYVTLESPAAQPRSKDRHKEGQAAYMRKWRADQKLKKAAK